MAYFGKKISGSPQEALVEPRKGRREKQVPAGIILGFTPPDLKLILEKLGASRAPCRKLDFWKLWTLRAGSLSIGVAGPAFGAPAAVVLLERLVALGGKAFIGVGSCGSLQTWLPVGSVVLPESALVEEGTSAHYMLPHLKARPHGELLELLRQSLGQEGLEPKLGRIWTTDAVFRETKEKVLSYQRQGVLGVDMESSALMSAAAFRNVGFASAMVVSDELGGLKWHRGFHTDEFRNALGRTARAAARCLKRWQEMENSGKGLVDL